MKTQHEKLTKTPNPVDFIDPDYWRSDLLPQLRWPTGTKVESVRITRVYPSRLEGFGVQAEISILDERKNCVAGCIYLTSGMKPRETVSRTVRIQPTSPFLLSSVFCPLEQTSFALHTADFDDALPCVAESSRLRDASPRLRDLARTMAHADLGNWRCRLGNYRPRRRCTLIYQSNSKRAGPFFVGKMFRKEQSARHGAMARKLSAALRRVADDIVVAPRVQAVWSDWSMVVFEGLGDGNSNERLSSFDLCRPAADVLARLHSISIKGLLPFGPLDELHATRRWVKLADRLGKLRPLGGQIWSTLVHTAPRATSARRCVIHRDFYASQLLSLGDRWGLVDFDTAAVGDPEQDIANFIGHMIWDCIVDGRRTGEWLDSAVNFVQQYATQRAEACSAMRVRPTRLSPVRLRFYLTSSLLRVGIIHSLRTGHERRALALHRVATGELLELFESDFWGRRLRAAV